jgi:callose synthase
LDFFRLLSFYYGGIGHYIANAMVMFTLVVVVYCMVGLAIFKEEGVNQRPIHPEGVLQLLLSGLGLLQTMPLAVTLTVEKGIIPAIKEILYMFISGGPLYFIFHIQTKCYYFSQTLMTGGAAYRPTGRGFVIRHSPFDENYRFFATSHIYLGFELMVALIIFAIHTKSKQYGGLTWSLWMTVVSFMLGPFWFNPVTFEWNKLQEDYSSWLKWMTETGGSSEVSWYIWWKEENLFYKDLPVSWKCFLFVQKCCLWLIISIGLAQARFFRDADEQRRVLELFALYIIFILVKTLQNFYFVLFIVIY